MMNVDTNIAPATKEAPEAPAQVTYQDDDLVYVDPELRTVVGRVEWSNAGKPKSLAMKKPTLEESTGDPAIPPAEKPAATGKDGKPDKRREKRGPVRVRYYPWGTYRSMKRVYKIEGKIPKEESNKTLDEVIEKALNEPFWD